jgi:hypothetical protein
MPKSLLPVVAAADNFLYLPHASRWSSPNSPPTPEVYISLHLSAKDFETGLPPIGLLRPEVIEALAPHSGLKSSTKPMTLLGANANDTEAVCFSEDVVEDMSFGEVLNGLAVEWKKEGRFPGPLNGMSH